jgi:amino acid adenylation domain-containing protein
MALWDNYENVSFQVVVNSAGQLSAWPTTHQLPPGWVAMGFSGPQRACFEAIDREIADAAHGGFRALAGEAGPADSAVTGPVQPGPDAAALLGRPRRVPSVSITSLIKAQELPPDRPAAMCGSERLTRGALFDISSSWAQILATAGCAREIPVALLLPRGLDALTAILAVLEAGGAYVPISCDDHPERIEAILEDCGVPIVITTDEISERLGGLKGVLSSAQAVLTLSALRSRERCPTAHAQRVSGENLAYIFYTSGTTGEPKGVEGTHRQLVNHALWCRDALAHRPGEVTFLSASLSFLGSLTTIFTPLLAGWPIVVLPDGADTDELLELSRATDGGLLKLTPTHIRMMMTRGVPGRGLARQLMVGSEPLTFSLELKTWMRADPARVVVNHYGLTETHGCLCHWLSGNEDIGSRVPAGAPVDNVEAYIVDRDCQLAGVGEVGELLVGGPSVGRGYRGRPALTAQRWIPNPWGTHGARLLRTGDLARMGTDRTVTVLGRADRQVKIRGHRIEPSAVEEVLTALPGVKEALVVPRIEGDKVTLDAFLLSDSPASVDMACVRDALARFPPQWIPARMAVLSHFPVNANGKIDTQALPVPQPLSRAVSGSGSSRWSKLDRVVADAFCEVLALDEIGLSDDFYDLGGDSLASVEVAACVGRELGKDVPGPSAGAATVRAYAQRISSLAAAPASDVHAERAT